MKNRSLTLRLGLVLLLQGLLILLLWFYNHNIALDNFKKLEHTIASQAAESLLAKVSREFELLRGMGEAIAASTSVQDFLREENVGAYYEKAMVVSEILNTSAFPLADGIVLINASGDYYRFSGQLSNESCERLYEIFQGEGSVYTAIDLGGISYFCHSSPIFSAKREHTAPLGQVVMLTATSKTRQLLSPDSECEVFLLSEAQVLISSLPTLERLREQDLRERYDELLLRDVHNSSLSVGAVIPSDMQTSGLRLFVTLSLVMVALLLLAVLLIYHYLSRGMIRPMAAILKNVQAISDGSGRLPSTGRADFDQLTEGINTMLARTERYHLGLLDWQINTHFVVNTLIGIEGLSQRGEFEKVTTATAELTRLLRHAQAEGNLQNIFLEMEFTRSYIRLMNIRHNDKFLVDFEVDDSLADYRIPSFILQPIVENALTHGLVYKEQDARLFVGGSIQDDGVLLEVCDNGLGLSPAQAEELIAKLSHAHEGDYLGQKEHGIALCNIQRRLRALYGAPYGLTLESRQNEGTRLRIHLPLLEDAGEDPCTAQK